MSYKFEKGDMVVLKDAPPAGRDGWFVKNRFEKYIGETVEVVHIISYGDTQKYIGFQADDAPEHTVDGRQLNVWYWGAEYAEPAAPLFSPESNFLRNILLSGIKEEVC